MPDEPEEPQEGEDEELDELKAELEKERSKYAVKKPATPAGQQAAAPPVVASAKPQEGEEEDLEALKAELDAERAKHAIPAKPPPPPAPPKPTAPTPKPAEEKPITQTAKIELTPIPQKKIVRPTLEPLTQPKEDSELIPETEPKKTVVKKSRPILLIILLIALIAAAAYIITSQKSQPEVNYQCWDESWVKDKSECPATTTTQTTKTTRYLPPKTTTTIETTTTTTIQMACASNSECEKPVPYAPFCDGKYVKIPAVKYTCIHPGTPDSYCQALATTPKLLQTCEDVEYCYGGQCFPEHCRNKMRDPDHGETKVDCGGKCRPCTQTDTICYKNIDCGKDECTAPYCNSAQNPTHDCTRNICNNPSKTQATCTQDKTTEVLQVCTRGKKCIDGQDDCMEGGGLANCHNCIQDQGELGVDCGGPCKSCATKVSYYDILNLTAADTIEYQTYTLKLERLLREMNCSVGANVRAQDPYGFSKSLKIDHYTNAEFYDIKFGMIEADTNSIRVWINKKIPI